MEMSQDRYLWFWIALVSGFILIIVFVVSLTFFRGSQASQNIQDLKQAQLQTQVAEQELVAPVEEKVVIEEPAKLEIQKVRMIAVGDMMLDRTVYLHTLGAGDYNFPFARISDYLQSSDLTVGNLEGALTDNKSISNGEGGDRFYFTFSPNFVKPLAQNFDVVSLANNHTLNFGENGLVQARNFLASSTLAYFGDPLNRTGELSVVVEKNGISFAFVGFHELVETGFENVITEIKNLRDDVDVIIIYPHWGYEYVRTNPSKPQISEAHALIEAGADMIIGAHPHVIQPIEIYKGKLIFYSLGNFVFDQYFSEETQEGLVLDIDIEKNEDMIDFSYTLVPIRVSGESQPFLAQSLEKKQILDSIAKYSQVSTSTQEMIKNGYISL